MKLTHHPNRHQPAAGYRQAGWIGLILLLMLSIAALDLRTGELPVHHFYYLPILLAAMRFKKAGGLVAACGAGILYHLTNPNLLRLQHAERDLLQLGIFASMGWVTAKLAEDAAHMRQLAHTDDLTGLHNLRSFEDSYQTLIREARANQTPLALLVLDLDHLKSINERYGHLAGAHTIQALGKIIAEYAPPEAIACRFGGDEFVIVLPACPLPRAAQVAAWLHLNLLQLSPTLAGHSLPPGLVTTSVGVASLLPQQHDNPSQFAEELFRRADQALYQAKAEGRNRICYAHSGQ
ncbi:MAG TPA: GGDEF domain-containing protein [Blastocatellia bacterium]|nr:GGDEF domain-containing protein [Blastocatellia bacterium]